MRRATNDTQHATRNMRQAVCTTLTYKAEGGGAEPSTAIKPIVVAQFINLDSLPIRRRMRHRLCRHRQRFVGVGVGSQAIIVLEQIRRKIQMLLKGKFGVGLGENKRSHFLSNVLRAR